MKRGNKKNIEPTKEMYEKAKKGIEQAFKSKRINQAQRDGLLKGLAKRYAGVI